MAVIPGGQKFHTVNENVDTKDRGSAQANSDREVYSMQDIIDSVPSSEATKDFIATGTIGAGDVVGLRSDGTVEVIAGTYVPPVLNDSLFNSGTTDQISSVYDATNSKVIISYRDGGNSNYGTVIVGTVSGTVITFGTAQVFNSASTDSISSVYDATNSKVIISYRDGGNYYGTVIVGTVSGTVITFGTAQVFNSASTSYLYDISSVYDATNSKVIISYKDSGNSYYGTVIVGTVSGTVITFGTAQVFNSGSSSFFASNYISSVYDATNSKVIISYKDSGNGNFGTVIAGTVSGTVITFGTAQVFNSGTTDYISSVYDAINSKVIISYRDGGNSYYGTVIVGTVSGTVITFGTAQVFNSAFTSQISSVYDATNSEIIISYQDGGNSSYGTVIVGTVSGTVITFGTAQVFNSASTSQISSVYDAINSEIIISYQDGGNSYYGTVMAYVPLILQTNVSSTIGINTTPKVDGETAQTTTIGGVSGGHSALTIGEVYYTDFNGVISTTTNPLSGFKRLGVATSTTEILLDSQY